MENDNKKHRLLSFDAFLEKVRQDAARQLSRFFHTTSYQANLNPGRMLRTRLAATFAVADEGRIPAKLIPLATAVELAHTATVCHATPAGYGDPLPVDPVSPAANGPTPAVLYGDWAIYQALELTVEAAGIKAARLLLEKLKETCRAQTEGRLTLKGAKFDTEACVRFAKHRTGPLFAFAACLGAIGVPEKCAALQQAGYGVGTAFHLADDFLGARLGEPETKAATASAFQDELTAHQLRNCRKIISESILDECNCALRALSNWPDLQHGIARFFQSDFRQVFRNVGVPFSPESATVQPPPVPDVPVFRINAAGSDSQV